ncbi:MAG: hypothetical protein LKI94_11990 [Sporolactobacillus sp.]|jgi:hypothetical protein|nr:hypothetical protein [Sporolactobacillus sp.]
MDRKIRLNSWQPVYLYCSYAPFFAAHRSLGRLLYEKKATNQAWKDGLLSRCAAFFFDLLINKGAHR